jgi:hypothetical protein
MPTVLDLAGLSDRLPDAVRGYSWRPLLEGSHDWPRTLAVTSSRALEPPKCANTRTTLTTPQWTLILPAPNEGPELYHLALDPQQTLNLFDRHRPIARRIAADFADELDRLDAEPSLSAAWREAL